MRDTPDVLAVLHYHAKWLEYGLIDQQALHEQFAAVESGADDNLEHHRYSSFRGLLDRAVIDDVLLERFIELALLDEDATMAQAALAELVRHSGLTSEQFSYLKSHPAFATSELQNVVEQTDLLRLLDSSGLSDDLFDDLFDRCLFSGKDEVQRKLLSSTRLSKAQLQSLSDHGASRAIRNLAREKLRRFSDT